MEDKSELKGLVVSIIIALVIFFFLKLGQITLNYIKKDSNINTNTVQYNSGKTSEMILPIVLMNLLNSNSSSSISSTSSRRTSSTTEDND